MNTEIEIKTGHTYLVKKWNYDSIDEIVIEEISETSYKIMFENKNTRWMLKKDFSHYKIIEDLGNKAAKHFASNYLNQ